MPLYKKCNECNRKRKVKNHNICHICYEIIKTKLPKQSGYKVIDDFIRYTQSNYVTTDKGDKGMEFVSYDQFKSIEFIAEGGFSKIYKATWVDGPINNWDEIIHKNWNITRDNNYIVVLKKLNDSKNITSKELNELKIFYQVYSGKNTNVDCISKYFGITQDPITKDIIFIMQYYYSDCLLPSSTSILLETSFVILQIGFNYI
ncbi:hypothetical protein RhiirA5_417071 [Rhizophagus irregularis]|uniref:Protein kinase domain-containing protein n=1 Tax=Rhizophagus irregularis TaxID=588596 RepID=A0A2N0PNB3_9GLOM|nr:hypothetical protein RhiirA5_417071 [Rhizophagus irregularis]